MTMSDQKRALKILQKLSKKYHDAPKTYLSYSNEFEMLIATILSAQSTDACINKVTPKLFEIFPDAQSLMMAKHEDIVSIIRSCGKYNKKAEYIKDTARLLVENFSGKVPKIMKDLVSLKGVSRKTANVVLQVVFGINEGVVVDTHIMRVSQRLELTHEEKNSKKIEKDLMEILPNEQWDEYARLMGAHGRRTCKSRAPACETCAVQILCPSAGKFS